LVASPLVLSVIVLLASVIITLSDAFGALFGFVFVAATCAKLDGV